MSPNELLATRETCLEAAATILIVDDEPAIRMLLAEVLGDAGYAILEAESAAAALALIVAGGTLDLLVTDVGLPGGMNGRQLAAAARAIRPHLKVLFITGYAESSFSRRLAPGMHVMCKPFALETVAARIREIIAGS